MNDLPDVKFTDLDLALMSDDQLVALFQERLSEFTEHYRTSPQTLAEQVLREMWSRYPARLQELTIRENLLNRVVMLAQAYGFEHNGWHDSIRFVERKLEILHRLLTAASRALKDDGAL